MTLEAGWFKYNKHKSDSASIVKLCNEEFIQGTYPNCKSSAG